MGHAIRNYDVTLFSHRFTQMNADRFKYKEITDIILGSFYESYKANLIVNEKNISDDQHRSVAE